MIQPANIAVKTHPTITSYCHVTSVQLEGSIAGVSEVSKNVKLKPILIDDIELQAMVSGPTGSARRLSESPRAEREKLKVTCY